MDAVRYLILFWLASSAFGQTVSIAITPVDPDLLWNRFEQNPQPNHERASRLATLFQAAGCSDLIDEPVRRSKLPNVVCTLSGTTEDVIIVGAHYDKTAAGTGAFDNWSGASLLPSLYEALAEKRRRYTFRFIGFSDEEKGFYGSKSHARKYGSNSIPKPHAMINLDTIGAATTNVWLSRADGRLADALFEISNTLKLPLNVVNVENVGSTDSESFRAKKIPVITIHSLTQELMPKLHSEGDQVSLVSRSQYAESYRLILAYLAYLDAVWRLDEGS